MNEIEPHTLEQHTCSSDMLSALENLERMFYAYRFCMNVHAANVVLFGLAIEAQMLAIKMKAMLGRWNKYLPFHEVMDVKFDHWQTQVSEWIEVLGMNSSEELNKKYLWLEGCKEYMLDLYAQTMVYDEEENLIPRVPEFYEVDIKDDYQREMAAYMENMDELLCEMMDIDDSVGGWREDVNRMATDSLKEAYVNDFTMPFFSGVDKGQVQEYEKPLREGFEAMVNFIGVQDCALIALGSLQNQLCDLHALFNKALPKEMFIRLSTRLFYRHCMSSYREGEAGVNKWRNSWPEAKVKKNAEKKKEELKKLLASKPYGTELQEYISFDAPNLFMDSCFGRFLFKNRRQLNVEDVQYIHKVCRELNLLNELIGEEGADATTNSAPIRPLNAEEQEIMSKLEVLVKKAHWGRVSVEQVIAALHKALGLGPVFADTKLVEMSQSLWELLKKRRGCDAEKSLMVTWLNIVGYCVKKGFLSGGSPALTKTFFPKCSKDDYKAIDKGRNAENNKNFLAIIPLLDACFRV